MATLRKKRTKDGYVYAVDFYYLGKRYIKSTRTSDYRLAKQIMRDIEGKIARNIFKLEDIDEKHADFDAFMHEYFKYAESYKQASTIDRERIIVENFRKIVDNVDIRSIDAKILDLWKSKRLGQINPVTFNIELRTLKSIMNVGLRWRYVDTNPFDQISKLKVEERRLYMTPVELKRFFKALEVELGSTEGESRKIRITLLAEYFEFLLNTGLRREEALKLQQCDINLEQNAVYIRTAKDKEARVVPLTTRARSILVSLDSSLFSSLTKSYVTHGFAEIARKARLSGFKLHSLRHSFATRLIDLGVDVLAVSKILGHSDIRTTMIYSKVRLETMKNAVAVLENDDSPVTKWYLEAKTNIQNPK